MNAPSITSPITSFGIGGVGRTFQRQGLYTDRTGYGYGGSRRASDVGFYSGGSAFGSSGRRSTVGRSDNRLNTSTTSDFMPRSRGVLLTRPGSNIWATPAMAGDRGTSALTKSYGRLLTGDWSAGIPRPGKTSALNIQDIRSGPALADPNGPPSATRPSEDPPAPEPDARQTYESVIAGQIAAQRRIYLHEGWAAFREGRYQQACAKFGLADRASIGAPRERAEAQIACVFGRFAARQYFEATHSLRWLLESYPALAPDGDPSIIDLLPELPSRYGRLSDLDNHLSGLGGEINRVDNARGTVSLDALGQEQLQRLTRELIELRTLRAFVTYGIPAQRSAFSANIVTGSSAPWSNLPRLLAAPRAGTPAPSEPPSGPATGQPVSSEFPFNLFRERPGPAGATQPAP